MQIFVVVNGDHDIGNEEEINTYTCRPIGSESPESVGTGELAWAKVVFLDFKFPEFDEFNLKFSQLNMIPIDACFALSSMSMQQKSGILVFLDSRVSCLVQYANGISLHLSHAMGSCSS